MQGTIQHPAVEQSIETILVKIHCPLYVRLTTDPRPDLMDTKLWTVLLPRIVRQDDFKIQSHHAALESLHTLRCIGTVLRWNHHVNYKLVPLFGFGNWESQDDWDSIKHNLIPFAEIYRNWFGLIAHEDVLT